MKKLIVLVLLVISTTSFAQERNKRPQGDKMEQFTPEQQSQLMLKKMTLELDLTDAQKKEISTFISNKIAKKEAFKAEMKEKKEKGIPPTNDERFAMAMKMMDEKIATKKSMQKILNAKQFEKWESLKEEHHDKGIADRRKQRGYPERKG